MAQDLEGLRIDKSLKSSHRDRSPWATRWIIGGVLLFLLLGAGRVGWQQWNKKTPVRTVRAVNISAQPGGAGADAGPVTLNATGYIIDRGVAVLRGRGFDNLLVDVGGDILVGGGPAPGRPWRIGLRNPRSGPPLLGRFEARDCAVATSGDYMHTFTADRRQHHIVDPRTGYSPPELASSTVIAPDAASADALSTLTLVLGARGGRELLESLPGCEGYLVGKDLAVTRTSGFVLI